jgi:hypothetical protein
MRASSATVLGDRDDPSATAPEVATAPDCPATREQRRLAEWMVVLEQLRRHRNV